MQLDPEHIALLAKLRSTRPLVHNLTSATVANFTANALLALGAAPAMVEAVDEFETLARTVIATVRKFAHGIYLIWYPVKSEAQANAFTGEVLAAGDVTKALTIDTTIAAREGKLNRAALLVVNPPYGLAAQMQAVADVIAPRLDAVIRITWIAGSE